MKFEAKPDEQLTAGGAGKQIGLGLVLVVTFVVSAATSQAVYGGQPKVDRYSKVPEAAKINVNLLRLEEKARTEGASLTAAAAHTAIVRVANGVVLDIVTSRLDPSVEKKFLMPGVTVRHFSAKYNRVSVVIDDLTLLYELAKIPEVRMILPEYGARTHVGSVTSRAVIALTAGAAMANFGVNGTGQIIGILSDSFSAGPNRDADTMPAAGMAGTLTGSPSQDSSDLPATVDIRKDIASGTDEGAAMAELAFDIASAAAIAFYTAFVSQADFATGITDLCTPAAVGAGANVVVDDVIYFAEPMYQDGIVAQAAADCVTAGVPYFSSAGNDANLGFRETYADIDPIDDTAFPASGRDLHNWGGGDGFLDVTLPDDARIAVVLQWNQPFESLNPGPGAGSQIDLDLYITQNPDPAELDPAIALAFSVGLQGTTGAPKGDAVEIAPYTNMTGITQTVHIAVDHFDGSQGMIPQDAATPVELRLVVFADAGVTVQGITNTTSAFGGPTIYGHAMAAGATSVAAVPWWEAPAFDPVTFGPTMDADPESFTARGGSLTVQFDPTGAFAPRTSFEPDIAAVDGNNTTFFGADLTFSVFGEPDGFPNFFGTSAAAPNAAAVAALIRDFDGTQTPAEIDAALKTTAIDITGFRAAAGLDDVTGLGLIDADFALGFVSAANDTDVSVTESGSPDPVTVGSSLTYTITVANAGPGAATGVTLTDTLPAGVTFVSAAPSQGSCSGTSTVTCDLMTVIDGVNATVTLIVTPTTANPALSNTASVSGNFTDTDPGNNSATAMTTVENPVPALTTLNPNTAFVGGPAFTLIVTGTNFLNPASTVQWDGTARTTTFVSSTQLQAAITAADIAAVGTVNVTVVNNLPGGGPSNALTLSIVNPPPPPPPPSTSKGGGGGCFIATAAYGTPMAEEIRYLRAFRDGYLLPNRIGRRFVELYYRYSPPIADYISQRQPLRRFVRVALMPLVTLSKWLVGDRIADNSHHTLR
ncbi:MAG: CFI-box-CTERM domain-containing protein [Phycisphaerae bacterium]